MLKNETSRRVRGPNGVVRRLAKTLSRSTRFDNSADYWENRYRSGKNSGAGSYNRLAAFKAEVLNEFVVRNDVMSVIEFGVGDGAQLSLARYPSYTGVDVSETVVEATRRKFAADDSITILHTSGVSALHTAELALSLDVVYHLVEDETFEAYMMQLFDAATRYVIVYASDFDSDWPDPHVRHREFTRWIEANRMDFERVQTIENRYPYSAKDPENTSFANFHVFSRTSFE
ncbi:hypothetical protein ACFQWH_00835 [Mycolicibacterium sp. GCM10028919]|uniref:hypothetical protein n=1 Tax=Mycolicibacterium sp. GCM10028919 TaxID=3273401 RepID=UPI0036152AF8